MLGPFGVRSPSSHILVEDGKVVFQPTKPGFYDALVFYHELYKEGLLDPEGFSQRTEQSSAKVRANVLGIMPLYNPPAGLGYVPLSIITGPDGTALYEGNAGLNAIANFSITAACKKPQVLVRYYEHVNQDADTV